jgi:hypothetical protein
MYDKYLRKDFILEQDEKLPRAIIVDIDGTLAIKGDRDIFDYSKVHLDLPNKPIVDLVH